MTGGKVFRQEAGRQYRLGKSSAAQAAGVLPWAPPAVTYTDLHINLAMTTPVNTDIREVILTPGVDYNLIFDEVIHQRIRFTGGRHVKIIGAEFNIDSQTGRVGFTSDQGDYYANCTGPEFQGQTGTLFIEGLWVHGPYALDGLRQPGGSQTDLVLQNCRMECDRIITGLSDVADGFWHTDGIQSWGGMRSQRAYNVTIANPYQGGMFGDGALAGVWGPMIWNRVNLRPGLTVGQASKMFNIVGNATYMKGPLSFKDVYYAIGAGTEWSSNSYHLPTVPPYTYGAFYGGATFGTDEYGRDYAVPPLGNYPGLRGIDDGEGGQARIYRGLPANGDYVPSGTTGAAYVSPGYLS